MAGLKIKGQEQAWWVQVIKKGYVATSFETLNVVSTLSKKGRDLKVEKILTQLDLLNLI